MLSKLKIVLVFCGIILTEMSAWSQGCAQCKARIESADAKDLSVGNGINWGIGILMLMPYVILFFLFRKRIIGFLKEFAAMWNT